LGGLSKKAYELQELRGTIAEPQLTLDAGGLLFDGPEIAAGNAEQKKITAEGIVAAYNLMGYEAVGVAPNDLAAGPDYLLDLQKKSRFHWLSANIVDADDTPLFTPYLIFKLPGTTCAVIGITGNEMAEKLEGNSEFKLASWQRMLPPLVATLSKRSDFIILLSSLGSQENIKVAEGMPAIRLIVEANGGPGNKPPAQVNQTLITNTFRQGKFLGALKIDWQPTGRWRMQDLGPMLQDERAALDRIDWQIRRMKAGGDAEKRFRDEPKMLAAYRRLQEERTKQQQKVSALEQQQLAEKENKSASTFKASFYPMEKSLPDQPEILALVAGIKDKIAAAGKSKAAAKATDGVALPGGDPGDKGYVGWQRCAGCHAAITEAWRKTRHAGAYDSLADKGQQFDQHCLACHVTGVIRGDEPYILTLPEDLMQVGCEACHGPGRAHAENSATPMPQRPEQAVCSRCHTAEQDDNFVYQAKIKLVH